MNKADRRTRNALKTRRFSARGLSGTAAIALAAAASQNASAATVYSAYQSVYTANSINGVGAAGTGKLLYPTKLTVPSNDEMTLTVQQGTYFAFDLGVAATGNPNAAAGAAYDQANGLEEPAQLGLGEATVNVYTGNVNVVAPLYTDFTAGPGVLRTNGAVDHIGQAVSALGALTSPGDINTATGEVGQLLYPSAGFVGPVDVYQPLGNIGVFTGSATNAANQLFNQMGYEAVSVGTTQVTTLLRSAAITFVTLRSSPLALENSSVEPLFSLRGFDHDAVDSITNVPALTIDVVPDSVTDVPEPAELGVLASAVTLLLCRRRRPRT